MKTEMSYDELMDIWAPLYDATTMVECLRKQMGGLIRDEFMNGLEAKLGRALSPIRERIDEIKKDNPEQFG